MATVTLRFSRAAPLTWQEKWRQKDFIYYSMLICRLTHSPFSHVDLLLDDGNLLGSSNSPHTPVVSGNPAGVAIRPPDYQRFAVRRDAIIPTTDQRKKRFTDFCMAQLGKPFDGEALSPRVFLSPDVVFRDWRENDKWFCAELMGRATEIAPLLGWTIPGVKNRITPADLVLLLAPLYDYAIASKPIPGLKLEPWES
jgi:hypothetical protein